MTREELIGTARELPRAAAEAAREYAQKCSALVAEVDRRMLQRPDLERLVGEDNSEMMRDNHANHARFVSTILQHPNPEVLVDTVLWVFRAYRSHGFHLSYWPAQLNTWVEVLEQQLSAESFAGVYPLYQWFVVNQSAFAALSDSQLDEAAG
jgi:hypothetical protein